MNGSLSLLLHGNGDGSFAPIGPKESGLVIPGDAKGLAVTDLNNDGWPDFIVGINNQAPLSFQNRGSQDNRLLIVRLHGNAGNPAATGSRISLVLTDRSIRTAEVQTGSGYLSQSSAVLTFGLGPTNHASQIRITWPDGTKTARSVVRGDSKLEFIQSSGSIP